MIGNVIGNYKILEKIGEGGMGAVYKGVDLMLEREVAIKALRPELARQPHIVERFRAEAVTLAKLSHPNIATLHSFVREVDDYFMVMEFVRGETLDSELRRAGGMPVDRAITLFCHALEGIDHAHKMGIVHRDIKPANMMLTDSGSIKVMDFGIARVLGSARMTKQGNVVGTVEYMSPEQVRGQDTDARSDIYSLGILLYEMLTGRVPFTDNSEYELMRSQIEEAPTPPRDFAPHIPLPVEEAIMRSLAKKAEARFQSAGEFRKALLASVPAVKTSALSVSTTPLAYQAPQFGQTIEGIVSAPGEPSRETTPMVNQPFSGNTADHFSTSGESGQHLAFSPGPLPKETRMGMAGSQAKETRMGAVAAQTAVPAAPALNSAYEQGGIQAQAASGPSAGGRLNWKHYRAAAAILLIGLIATAVVAVVVMRKQSRTGRDPLVAPPQDTYEQDTYQQNPQPPGDSEVNPLVAPPQDTYQQNPQPPGDSEVSKPGVGIHTLPSPDVPAPDKTKRADSGARPVDTTKPQDASAADPLATAAPGASVEPSKPKETLAVAPAGPKEKPSPDDKRASADGNKEKKGGLGGFFKKIGGILKGDDKDKDKKQH